MRVRFVPLAKREVFHTSCYYDKKRTGLGDEFLDELARVIALIRAYPKALPVVFADDIRRVRLNRFPYAVVSGARPDEIVIFAVQHLKRRPNTWQKRIKTV